MFPKIRLVNGRAITAESPAAGLHAALVTGAERLEDLQRHYRNMAREAREKGTPWAPSKPLGSGQDPRFGQNCSSSSGFGVV